MTPIVFHNVIRVEAILQHVESRNDGEKHVHESNNYTLSCNTEAQVEGPNNIDGPKSRTKQGRYDVNDDDQTLSLCYVEPDKRWGKEIKAKSSLTSRRIVSLSS